MYKPSTGPTFAEAMLVAWEQCVHWQVYMTSIEAAEIVGCARYMGWSPVAHKLAAMWLELHGSQVRIKRAA